MTPLASLLAEVEAGLIPDQVVSFSPRCGYDFETGYQMMQAYQGSTDAAISLCGAMLPGAELMMYRAENGPEWMVNLRNQDSVFNPDPARALLIALLRAMVAREGGE